MKVKTPSIFSIFSRPRTFKWLGRPTDGFRLLFLVFSQPCSMGKRPIVILVSFVPGSKHFLIKENSPFLPSLKAFFEKHFFCTFFLQKKVSLSHNVNKRENFSMRTKEVFFASCLNPKVPITPAHFLTVRSAAKKSFFPIL